MYAQLICGTSPEGRLDELDAAIRNELVPALRGELGFSGVLSLVESRTARTLLIVFWETEEEAARLPAACDEGLAHALRAVRSLACPEAETPQIWEVRARA
jgi:hypothetical protein